MLPGRSVETPRLWRTSRPLLCLLLKPEDGGGLRKATEGQPQVLPGQAGLPRERRGHRAARGRGSAKAAAKGPRRREGLLAPPSSARPSQAPVHSQPPGWTPEDRGCPAGAGASETLRSSWQPRSAGAAGPSALQSGSETTWPGQAPHRHLPAAREHPLRRPWVASRGGDVSLPRALAPAGPVLPAPRAGPRAAATAGTSVAARPDPARPSAAPLRRGPRPRRPRPSPGASLPMVAAPRAPCDWRARSPDWRTFS